jgi:hypothetical protein
MNFWFLKEMGFPRFGDSIDCRRFSGPRPKEVKAVSKNNIAIRGSSKLPAAVKKFWGPPPIARSESEDEYWSFAAAVAHDLDPTDSIMLLLVKDVIDYSWEIRQLRKHQAQLSFLAKLESNRELTAESKRHNEKYFASAHGEADLFLQSLGNFEALDRLLGLAEGRRMAALREIENYREALAERLRERSDDAIIDGEFSEAAPRLDSGGNANAKTSPTGDSTRIDGAAIERVETACDRGEGFESQSAEIDSASANMPGNPA